MGDFVMVGNAIYTAEDVAKLLDELCAARLAVAPPLPWQIRAETDKIRAEVAEGIAQAIERSRSHPEHEPTCPSCITEAVYIDRHAAMARGRAAHEHRGAADQTGQGQATQQHGE